MPVRNQRMVFTRDESLSADVEVESDELNSVDSSPEILTFTELNETINNNLNNHLLYLIFFKIIISRIAIIKWQSSNLFLKLLGIPLTIRQVQFYFPISFSQHI